MPWAAVRGAARRPAAASPSEVWTPWERAGRVEIVTPAEPVRFFDCGTPASLPGRQPVAVGWAQRRGRGRRRGRRRRALRASGPGAVVAARGACSATPSARRPGGPCSSGGRARRPCDPRHVDGRLHAHARHPHDVRRGPAGQARRRRRPARRRRRCAGPSPSSRTGPTGWPTSCSISGPASGTKVVWCGQNSPGIVAVINAARKIGVTAVPLNYRLSAEEAAYVTDHCDATIVYVDAEFAPLFERIRNELPKVQQILVFDGSVPDGMLDADALVAAASPDAPPRRGRAGGDDDLHVGHDRQAQGRLPQGRRRPGAGPGHGVADRLPARRRVHHDRAPLPLRPRRVHGHRARPSGRRS